MLYLVIMGTVKYFILPYSSYIYNELPLANVAIWTERTEAFVLIQREYFVYTTARARGLVFNPRFLYTPPLISGRSNSLSEISFLEVGKYVINPNSQ